MLDILIEDSWSHPWEGFRSSYLTCTQPELGWVAEEYAGEPTAAGWPAVGSICERLNHVGACKQAYAWDIRNPTRTDGATAWTVHHSRVELMQALDSIHADFVAACRSADHHAMILGKGGHTFPQYLGIAIRHEIWHAGQIALLRRLYAKRSQQIPRL